MGTQADPESSPLIVTPTNCSTKVPRDKFHLAYVIYFTLGAGYLLPWNAFITAVDYFSYLYPEASVDRVFSVVYMIINLSFLLLIVLFSHRSNPFVRINVGLVLFVVALTAVPVMDVVWIKGRAGMYSGFYATVAAVVVSGVADALVQGGVIGSAGELPERYMQAVVAGTAASASTFRDCWGGDRVVLGGGHGYWFGRGLVLGHMTRYCHFQNYLCTNLYVLTINLVHDCNL